MLVTAKSLREGMIIQDKKSYGGDPWRITSIRLGVSMMGKHAAFVGVQGKWIYGGPHDTTTPTAYFPATKKVGVRPETRHNPRQVDADEDIRIDVFMEDDVTGAWVKETTCTLAEFFAVNETVTRKEIRPLLFMRGQYVDGGGASARWKIAFAK